MMKSNIGRMRWSHRAAPPEVGLLESDAAMWKKLGLGIVLGAVLWGIWALLQRQAAEVEQRRKMAFATALIRKDSAQLRRLVKDGVVADLDHVLEATAELGDVELIRLLLARGASPDGPDGTGETPIRAAAAKDQVRAIRLLIQKGARVDGPNWDGELPLVTASQCGNLRSVQELLKYGANVEVRDAAPTYEWTALMWAADLGHVHVVRTLLHAGASAKARDESGRTALQLARRSLAEEAAGRGLNDATAIPRLREIIRILERAH